MKIDNRPNIFELLCDNPIDVNFGDELSEKDKNAFLNIDRATKSAKRFLLDVEPIQNLYSIEYKKLTSGQGLHLSSYPFFNLPFENTLLAFKKPLEIHWSKLKTYGVNSEFDIEELAAILILEANPIDLTEREEAKEKSIKYYRICLFFEENGDLKIENRPIILSKQYIDINIQSFMGTKASIIVHHLKHLCSDPDNCEIQSSGQPKEGFWLVEPSTQFNKYCQHYADRKALVEMIIAIVNDLGEKEIIEKHPERAIRTPSLDYNPLRFLRRETGFQYETKTPLPYYESKLSEIRYKYNQEEIAIGTGSQHHFRYDVRRHPRIMGNTLIWIASHQRGDGEYIPKLYTKGKIFIPYFWEKIEEFSRYNWFNRMLVKIIKMFRQIKNYDIKRITN